MEFFLFLYWFCAMPFCESENDYNENQGNLKLTYVGNIFSSRCRNSIWMDENKIYIIMNILLQKKNLKVSTDWFTKLSDMYRA